MRSSRIAAALCATLLAAPLTLAGCARSNRVEAVKVTYYYLPG